ncbi:MAG: molybdopterin oxidoreductase family protein [Deltaproteobacteria bacterium]|nr:MAG: molybdopterin oxidoreductase family protein [Deltaproteobacteria bacterium]
MTTTHIATCTLCEATCGILVDVEDGRVTRIQGDPDDPFSKGHICPKAAALADLQHDADRVTHPLRRTDTGWERVSWDEALDDIAARIHALQEAHGRDAMAVYQGNPCVHNLGVMLFNPGFVKALRTTRRYSATSVDQLPHMLASLQMFGHELLLPVPDVDHTDLMIVFGANPLVSNGSILTAPDMKRRLAGVAERGRLVVFDPRRTETAKRATAHHFIRPGTDVFALLAMLHVVFAERGAQLGHLADGARNLEVLRAWAADVTPEVAARVTGVDAEVLRELALALCDTPRAVVYGRMGACTQDFGGTTAMLLNALNAVTGHLDREGGLMFTQPALPAVYPPAGRPGAARRRFARWRSRVRGLPEFGGELPVATLAEDILEPGDDRIRGLVVWAGNPVLSCPNGAQLDEAMAALDLLVSVDLYLTETSRHAHYVLPVVPPLSRPHYDAAFHALATRNVAKFSPPVLPATGEERQDWEVATALQARLQALRGVSLAKRATLAAQRALGPRGVLAAGLRLGPHGLRNGRGAVSLRKLEAHPHGLDLGPLHTCLRERMPSDWPGLDLCPEIYTADRDRVAEVAASDPEPLVLIGRRQLRTNNSWLHNAPRLMKGKDRCTLMVHPDDAASRGLAAGDRVRVRSRVGVVEVPVELTDTVMRGVVSLPHGFGHGREGVSWTTAARHPGASINDLTDEQRVDPISGNAALNGTPVHLEKV